MTLTSSRRAVRSTDCWHAEQCSSRWSSIDLRRRSESPTDKSTSEIAILHESIYLDMLKCSSTFEMDLDLDQCKPHLHARIQESIRVDMFLTKYLISSQRSLEISYPMCHMCIEALLALGNPTIILFPLPQMSARCKGPQVIEQHHRLPTVLPSERWTAVTCCHIVVKAVFVRNYLTNWLCCHQFHLPLSIKLCWDITRLAPKGESHGKELNRLGRHQAYHGIQNQRNLYLWIHLEWPSEEALGH